MRLRLWERRSTASSSSRRPRSVAAACSASRRRNSSEHPHARSRSTSSSSGLHSCGWVSIAHSEPSTCPSWSVNGIPAYATTPSSVTAGLPAVSSCARASVIASGAPLVTTCRQNECDSGVHRAVAHGWGRPADPGNTCLPGSTRLTSATGTRSQRRTRSATASMSGSGAAVNPMRAKAAVRPGSASAAASACCSGVAPAAPDTPVIGSPTHVLLDDPAPAGSTAGEAIVPSVRNRPPVVKAVRSAACPSERASRPTRRSSWRWPSSLR